MSNVSTKQGHITRAGDNLTREILGVFDGSESVVKTGCGDILWYSTDLPDDGILIECKDGSANQVRPKCYCVVIIRELEKVIRSDGDHVRPTGRYFVIPPNDIIRFAVGRRGQHHIDPIACLGFSIKSKFVQQYATDYSMLREKVIAAYVAGKNDTKAWKFVETRKAQWATQMEENEAAFT